jgi:hypothetical protein
MTKQLHYNREPSDVSSAGSMTEAAAPPSTRKLIAYFVPLALQAASQSLSYPLIAMVASHGPGGALALAGVAQSNIIMFLVATLGSGVVTAGMVFGKTKAGFAQFRAINNLLSMVMVVVQTLMCIPFVGRLVFGTLLGLPPSIQEPAMQAFPLTVLLNVLFNARNPYQVLLYNNGAPGRASTATFVRIGVTLALSPMFCSWGLVGPRWAMVCQTIPVGLEVLVSWWYSRPFADSLAEDVVAPPTKGRLLSFTMPLSLGGFLMTLSAMILGAIIARSGSPEHMLPVYYLAVGIANPAAYAASRVQNVMITFPPRSPADNQVFRFSIAAGAMLSFVPLLFVLPGIADWYYISVQKLPAEDLSLVTTTALLLVVFPFTVALRCHREGLAALERRTPTILAGDFAYIAALAVCSSAFLALRIPGNVIGPLVIGCSNLASLGILVLLLRERRTDVEPAVAPVVSQEL